MTDFDDDTPHPPRKRIKAHDLRICTWNIRSLNRPFLSWQLFSKIIKLTLLLSKKCDGQVRNKQISVPVMSTIVALLLGTNSGVALQCAGISENSSQDLLQLTNA